MEHTIKRGEYLSLIASKYKVTLNQLLSANPRYKADPDAVRLGDKLVIPVAAAAKKASKKAVKSRAAAKKAAARRSAPSPATSDYFKVPAGQLTFDAEGLETPGKFFSRSPHVPGPWSGVTIGRGYDMKERSENEIIEDMTAASVPMTKARKLAGCRGRKGAQARKYLEDNDLKDLTINAAQQWHLFNATYAELEGDVIRISSKADVVAKYGATDWSNLDPLIRDIAVDLRYRGDYTGTTRERVQPVLVDNDLAALTALMADRDYWVSSRGVPNDRFKRRRDYLTA